MPFSIVSMLVPVEGEQKIPIVFDGSIDIALAGSWWLMERTLL